MIVRAKNETIAKHIEHPSGMRFLPDGTSDWPFDAFTKRRIRAGDVIAVTAEQRQEAEVEAVKPKAATTRDRHDITR